MLSRLGLFFPTLFTSLAGMTWQIIVVAKQRIFRLGFDGNFLAIAFPPTILEQEMNFELLLSWP